MPIKKLYHVIRFLTKPYWMTENFVAVPSTWVSCFQKQVMVALPLLRKKKLSSYIKKRKSPYESWSKFRASIEYNTDVYKDAVLYIKLRQELRSSYITTLEASPSWKLTGDRIQIGDVLSKKLNNTQDFPSSESSSTTSASENETLENPDSTEPKESIGTQQIYKKAIEHDLLIRIFDEFIKVNKLLDDYIKLKYQCSE